jgi:hypothetical protein
MPGCMHTGLNCNGLELTTYGQQAVKGHLSRFVWFLVLYGKV